MMRNILLSAIGILLIGSLQMIAQAPSKAAWLRNTGSTQIDGTETYNLELTWRHGIVDAEHPQAAGYIVYRSPIGSFQEPEDYLRVGAFDVDGNQQEITFIDEAVQRGAYYYYVVGYGAQDEVGERSPLVQAFAPSWYCIKTTDPVLVITTTPTTVIEAGTSYEYVAFARHRSARVQGFVRYELVTGPEGLKIDEITGKVSWEVPEQFTKAVTVKIRAWSLDDEDAESFQEWSIRAAEAYEVLLGNTVSVQEFTTRSTLVSPNPASTSASLTLENSTPSVVRVFDALGNVVAQQQGNAEMVIVSVENLAPGRYTIVAQQGTVVSTAPVIVQR